MLDRLELREFDAISVLSPAARDVHELAGNQAVFPKPPMNVRITAGSILQSRHHIAVLDPFVL
jgi:hypothetical protein